MHMHVQLRSSLHFIKMYLIIKPFCAYLILEPFSTGGFWELQFVSRWENEICMHTNSSVLSAQLANEIAHRHTLERLKYPRQGQSLNPKPQTPQAT